MKLKIWWCSWVALAVLSVFSMVAMAEGKATSGGQNPPEGKSADDKMIQLGKAMFFDPKLSHPNGQSCATCHDPLHGFADPDSTSPISEGAVKGRFGNRNAMSASYSTFVPPLHFDPTPRQGFMEGIWVGGLFWDGRAQSLEEQAKGPLMNPLEMHNQNRKQVVNAVRKSHYLGLFREVFGPGSLKNTAEAFDRVAMAISAYERSSEVNPFSSKFDAFRRGEAELTAQEANGYALFTGKARCGMCHTAVETSPGAPILFTNFTYVNLGMPRNPDNPFYEQPPKHNPDGVNFTDLGLGGILGDARENGKFRVPSLRNVAVTAPYGHNGSVPTLREHVSFLNSRDVDPSWPPPEVPETVHRHVPPMPGTIGMFGLSEPEIDDIVAFLETLTDGYQVEG